MGDLIPQKPNLTLDISAENVYQILYDALESERYETLLFKLYEKLTSLETKRNELEGKIMKKKEQIGKLTDALGRWESGEVNFLSNRFTRDEKDSILDSFFIMINEKPIHEVDHIVSAADRIEKKVGIHKHAAYALANFMDDLLSTVEDKMIPDDNFVYLQTSKLSMEEKTKIEELVMSGRDERIQINDKAITLNPEHLHIEGNQILINPKKMDSREREALSKALDPDKGSDSSIALPARALVQSGDNVNEENIRRFQSFPEENPDRDVEEANQEIYGEDKSTGSEGNPDDDLPF